ncbi:iron permease [Salmonella enterica subsp. diarizonae]|uniref:Iron permease n=2 Tax=Salmonella enterica TaxID=28901 RepID=A0A505CSW3_SALER|nr:FTR1 family protein [Salmonella enterica]EBH8655798.1 iron permease [Salmonella enterica subsp. enterica serovar Minnesota]EBL5307044.1 iron permease [Salmonella enterica subsp. enterica serovar Newport]ECG8630523.1 iron permease [Salmonella enterica subsp. salamae]EDQ5929586.1 iron permease [Salmonella enterica subsp. enterica serovar Javiana]EDV9370805.1 iron permease [Salmonella enterica subsp. enterica serovar Bovismorbificans]EEB3782372.1 iron permease [Salmonella enterica subsp. ente
MIAVILIVFREVLEAGLIISVILAACKGYKISHLVIAGITSGVIFSGLLALFTNSIENALSGTGQEVFNSALLLTATLMLSWQIVWMSTKGKEMADASRNEVRNILSEGNKNYAIAVVVAIAVMREGSEVVLFMYSIIISTGTSITAMFTGGIIGVIAGIVFTFLLYRGLILIPLKFIFLLSNIVLTFIAAGLASQGIGILSSIDIIPAIKDTVWDSSWLLSDNSWEGGLARAIFGYTSTPSGVQIITWILVAALILSISSFLKRKKS